MRRAVLALVLSASLFPAGSALAGPGAPGFASILQVASGSIVIPQEWDGIWTTVDSSYTCAGVLQSTSAGSDTLCGGKDYSAGSGAITFTCTGTADATTIDATCTGSTDVFTNCTANFSVVIHGTRTNDTFHIVSTTTTTYSGTGFGCNLLTPSCDQVDSNGTRIAPAPAAYCATPTRQSTWGGLKLRYR